MDNDEYVLTLQNLTKFALKITFFNINQLIDAIVGYQLLSFIDTYSSYNQIKMH